MTQSMESLGFLLADLSRLMRREFERRLDGSSLTLAQARALIHVARNEGIRQFELAGLLEIQPITLARLIDQLEHEHLVERRSDASDRRAYRLYLTDHAGPHLAAVKQVALDIYPDVLRGIDKQHAKQVLATLHAMRDNLISLPCPANVHNAQTSDRTPR